VTNCGSYLATSRCSQEFAELCTYEQTNVLFPIHSQRFDTSVETKFPFRRDEYLSCHSPAPSNGGGARESSSIAHLSPSHFLAQCCPLALPFANCRRAFFLPTLVLVIRAEGKAGVKKRVHRVPHNVCLAFFCPSGRRPQLKRFFLLREEQLFLPIFPRNSPSEIGKLPFLPLQRRA